MRKKSLLFLFAILLLGFFLRIYKLDTVPPGLGNDEISTAYDSYSVMVSGRDYFGELLPLTFRSHDDYKPPLYQYLAIPFIKVFGNTEIAIRLPSVIFGVLGILVLYLLVAELFRDEKLAVLSSFFLAITPWHVFTSRITSASNVALFFSHFGGLLISSNQKKKLLSLFIGHIFGSECLCVPH